MKSTNFQPEYKLYLPEENIFIEGEEVFNRGFTLTANGLPSYNKTPFACVILFWSGQIDKNMTKIFEGDICKMKVKNAFGSLSETLAVMRWNPQQFRFILMMGVKVNDNSIYSVVDVEKVGHEITDRDLAQEITNNATPKS